MSSGSHVRQACKLVINMGNYSAIHVDHEVQLELPAGNPLSEGYQEKVAEAQEKVDKMVMKHQMAVKAKIESILEEEARK